MDFQTQLQKYADLLVHSGINLQKGQLLCINAPISAAPLARLAAESAYKAGAKEVVLRWSDDFISRLKYDYAGMDCFETVPAWMAAFNNDCAEAGAGFLSIVSPDPDVFAGIDPKKPAAWNKAVHAVCKTYYERLDKGLNSWCIAAAASPEWAARVFPGLPEDKALEKLWAAIFSASRADASDPEAAWEEHRKSFQKRINLLNAIQFDRLHYRNSLGTDITIGLPKDHCWAGGGAELQNGVAYFPNIPTEEIFCSPDKNRAEGTVYSAMPLNNNGNLIDRFWLKFQEGQVVDFGAEVGYNLLKALIETDDGARRLGEAALIPRKSPIAQMGLLFYNTLFDENASCHFAIGRGFAECLNGGLTQEKEELSARGLNDSALHLDFMLGTDDLSITGVTADGREIPVFRDGNWAPDFA